MLSRLMQDAVHLLLITIVKPLSRVFGRLRRVDMWARRSDGSSRPKAARESRQADDAQALSERQDQDVIGGAPAHWQALVQSADESGPPDHWLEYIRQHSVDPDHLLWLGTAEGVSASAPQGALPSMPSGGPMHGPENLEPPNRADNVDKGAPHAVAPAPPSKPTGLLGTTPDSASQRYRLPDNQAKPGQPQPPSAEPSARHVRIARRIRGGHPADKPGTAVTTATGAARGAEAAQAKPTPAVEQPPATIKAAIRPIRRPGYPESPRSPRSAQSKQSEQAEPSEQASRSNRSAPAGSPADQTVMGQHTLAAAVGKPTTVSSARSFAGAQPHALARKHAQAHGSSREVPIAAQESETPEYQVGAKTAQPGKRMVESPGRPIREMRTDRSAESGSPAAANVGGMPGARHRLQGLPGPKTTMLAASQKAGSPAAPGLSPHPAGAMRLADEPGQPAQAAVNCIPATIGTVPTVTSATMPTAMTGRQNDAGWETQNPLPTAANSWVPLPDETPASVVGAGAAGVWRDHDRVSRLDDEQSGKRY